MRPGDVTLRDFRSPQIAAEERDAGAVRLLQWNIERGYELDKVIEVLKGCQADIIALQEVDIGCERSQNRDTGKEIAAALGMNYAFVCEFEELRSPVRDHKSQGGGYHGNAILSRWDFKSAAAIEHR